MEMRKILFFMAGLICLFLMAQSVSGCGKKKQDSTPIQQTQAAAEPQLPVLEQNLIYMNNREAMPAIEPDYSYTEFPNDLQPVPADAVPSAKLD